MSLHDHFRPPLSVTRPWEGFHSAWATMIAGGLNRLLLPRYVALPLTSRGPLVEIDVAAVEQKSSAPGVPMDWKPAAPDLDGPVDMTGRDLFEVRVVDQEGGLLVGVIELISPANKDRPAARQAFAGKCAGYLRSGVGLVLVDVVTTRQHDLHRQLLELVEFDCPSEEQASTLYAAAYRTAGEEEKRLQVWRHRLRVGAELPTLPLWLSPEVAVPVDLDASYGAACEILGIT
jgi:hypothetical protein